eukprot:CAMPEP_0197910660 /NCGR_PEP_ID=MMETSP1439-20131203/71314_1 /TAXON_ID=66791 /ORGANISM="Gonyaulax spinifera, Strain CCMP409" /LENGTH=51 /DNA_ID=CAMNT_0043532339 /DNA_START=46 /DNA_END=202 /DNA_ORIENTATION=+
MTLRGHYRHNGWHCIVTAAIAALAAERAGCGSTAQTGHRGPGLRDDCAMLA